MHELPHALPFTQCGAFLPDDAMLALGVEAGAAGFIGVIGAGLAGAAAAAGHLVNLPLASLQDFASAADVNASAAIAARMSVLRIVGQPPFGRVRLAHDGAMHKRSPKRELPRIPGLASEVLETASQSAVLWCCS